MPRWRDIKQGRVSKKEKKEKKKDDNIFLYASLFDRIKAFLTDTFMILMPIMYIIIYLGFGTLQKAGQNKALVWLLIFLFLGIIVCFLYSKKGQTPGLKAYQLKIIDLKTKQNPSFFKAFLRFFIFSVEFITILPLFFALITKNKQGIHDILTNTAIIYEKSFKN